MEDTIVYLTNDEVLAAGSPEGIREKLKEKGFPIVNGLPDYANYIYSVWHDHETGLNYFRASPKAP